MTSPDPAGPAVDGDDRPASVRWSGRVRVLAAWLLSAIGRSGGLLVVIALARLALDDDLVSGTVLLVSATGLSANVATAVAEATYREDESGRSVPVFGTGWVILTVVGAVLVGLASHSALFGAAALFVIAAQAPIADLRANYLMRGELARVYLPPLARDAVLLVGLFGASRSFVGAAATASILAAACIGVVVHYFASGGGVRLRIRHGSSIGPDASTMLFGQTLLVACPFVDRFVLGRFDGPAAVGTFEFGDRIGYLMQVVVWGGIMSELLRRWRGLGVGDPGKVQRELRQLFALALAISVVSVIVLAFVGEWLTVTLYGPYVDVEAVHLTMVIATASAGFIASSTLATRALLSQGRSRTVAIIYTSLFVSNVIGDLLVVGRFGAPGVAAVTGANFVIVAAVSLWLAGRGSRSVATSGADPMPGFATSE